MTNSVRSGWADRTAQRIPANWRLVDGLYRDPMPADIVWTTAFLDFTPSSHQTGVAFWSAVTGYTRSPSRGDHDEFATLVPDGGDAFLRVQHGVTLADGGYLHSPAPLTARESLLQSPSGQDGNDLFAIPGGATEIG